MFYPYKIKKYFKKGSSIKSITRIDKDNLRHGEKISWYDKAHKLPKSISVYHHGELIRCTKWYLNGNIKYYFNSYQSKRIEEGYYKDMSKKFYKEYKLDGGKWIKNGIWEGFYRNKNKAYLEYYNNDVLSDKCFYYYYNGNIKCIADYKDGIRLDSKCFGLYSYLREDNESNKQSMSQDSKEDFWGSIEKEYKISKNDSIDDDTEVSQNSQNSQDDYYETEKIFEEVEEEEEWLNDKYIREQEDDIQKILIESYSSYKTI